MVVKGVVESVDAVEGAWRPASAGARYEVRLRRGDAEVERRHPTHNTTREAWPGWSASHGQTVGALVFCV